MDGESRRFLERHTAFRHRDEIAAHVGEGAQLRASARGVPVREMLSTYSRRLDHLMAELERAEPGRDPEGERLRDDTRAFVEGLRAAGGDEVRFWDLTVEGGPSFVVFEAVRAGIVVGCLRWREDPAV